MECQPQQLGLGLVDYEYSDSESEGSDIEPEQSISSSSIKTANQFCLQCHQQTIDHIDKQKLSVKTEMDTSSASSECDPNRLSKTCDNCGKFLLLHEKGSSLPSEGRAEDPLEVREYAEDVMSVDMLMDAVAIKSKTKNGNYHIDLNDLCVVPRSACTSNVQHSECSTTKKRRISESENSSQLPVPKSIQSMFQRSQQNWVDNPSDHSDRIRSFAHQEGNWATHVYVEVPWKEHFFEFVNNIVNYLRPVPFHSMPEFHVSLSRTVPIRHHWIDPLVDSLRANFRILKTTISDLSAVKLFTNDEKTRTFLCLELSEEDTCLRDYVNAVDKSFAEFKLQKYYENPSFHISIGWCLGDVTKDVSEAKMLRIKEMFGEFIAANPDLSVVFVQQISCKSGNKCFVIPLQDGV